MAIVKTTRKQERTWLGIRGESWDFLATTRSLGRRVGALRWLEDNPNTGRSAGDLVLKDMTGDFWRGADTAVLHDEVVIPNGTDDDALRYAQRRLSDS